MVTKTKQEGPATAGETKNETLYLVVSPKSNFGRIGYQLSVKLNIEQLISRSAEGLLHIAQRAPASRVEKTLVGYKQRSDMPDEWTRSDIGYSDELARRFETELAEEIRKVAHLDVAVVADEYTPEPREVAYVEAKKIVKNAIAAKRLSNLVKNAGFAGEVTADNALENVEFLQAVEADRQARNKAMFS
jgi:hypothetical protein